MPPATHIETPLQVRVPGSSANLGPGFDALGLALDVHVEVGFADDAPLPAQARLAEPTHPAAVAHRRAGGARPLWVRGRIPMGRGMGFSGAVRVAGLIAAHVERHGGDVLADPDVRTAVLHEATALEGHPDNVAASLVGGFVVAAAGRAVRVPLALEPRVVVWVPERTTSTDQSRGQLPHEVPFGDAVHAVGRVALLVAALATGDVAALRDATQDRLHQDVRFASRPASAAALRAGLDAGAWCGWLSGSGPSVAFLSSVADADALGRSLPTDGHVKVLAVDPVGAVVEPVRPA